MESAECWKMLFENWPDTISRTGLLVTSYQETIPFNDFMISGGIVLLERDKPDASGARKVMLAYESIVAIKITEILDLARFQVMGFQPPF